MHKALIIIIHYNSYIPSVVTCNFICLQYYNANLCTCIVHNPYLHTVHTHHCTCVFMPAYVCNTCLYTYTYILYVTIQPTCCFTLILYNEYLCLPVPKIHTCIYLRLK